MSSSAVVRQLRLLREELVRFDPDVLSASACATLVDELSRTEKACAFARSRAAGRVLAAGLHAEEGCSDPAEWLGQRAGISTSEARAAIRTAESVQELAATATALASGEVSLGQAAEIARAAKELPADQAGDAEQKLLDLARRGSLDRVRDEARKLRLAAVSAEELYGRQRAARSVSTWTDGLGMGCGRWALTPEQGTVLRNRLQAETDRLHRAARSNGSTDTLAQHAADAFALLLNLPITQPAAHTPSLTEGLSPTDRLLPADGLSPADRRSPGEQPSPGDHQSPTDGLPPAGGVPAEDLPPGDGLSPSVAADGGGVLFPAGLAARAAKLRPRTELVIVCDINAYRRGHTHDGEVCHILGDGPIPVDVAKKLTEDAFLKAVLHDGLNIHTVMHCTRYRRAQLQTALDLGPPPEFAGAVCACCGRRDHLQWDHVDPVANDGPTSMANLAPRCWSSHQDKTRRDHAAGLLGPNAPNPAEFKNNKKRRRSKAGSDPPPEPPDSPPLFDNTS